MQSTMNSSNHNRSFVFFDLPREIRDDIYRRIMHFHDREPSILLAPRGMVPSFLGKPSEYRAELYGRYQAFVTLLTVSRRFHNEALPVFWQINTFRVSRFFSLASSSELRHQSYTSLNFIGASGLRNIANVRISVLCTVFIQSPHNNGRSSEYGTDLGTTIKGLLDMMPNLQRLDMQFTCKVERKDYPGEEKTHVVLEKAAGRLLEFVYPMQCFESSEPPKLTRTLLGNVTGRPIRALKKQETENP